VAALGPLDYSRGSFYFLSPAEVEATRGTALGQLSWDPAPYVTAPTLEPFRQLMRDQCSRDTDRERVACLIELFANRFPHGAPALDAFDPRYDPALDLAAHLAGAPGHCVTRSSLSATALLSIGIPARVVQLIAADGTGHNIFSFFDRQERRWVAVDPTYAIILHPPGLSIASAIRHAVTFDQIARAPSNPPGDPSEAYRDGALLTGHVVYPEPWLYTRVGPRVAAFPYTGHFVVVGAPTMRLGLLHRMLPIGAVVLFLVAVASAIGVVRRLRGQRSPEPIDVIAYETSEAE
jgi:hypothetical protein